MAQVAVQTKATATANELTAKIATTEDEIKQAMRLRYEVFAEEENNVQLMNEKRLERDWFDDLCDHLIVTEERTNSVVGTYRLLPGKRIGHQYGFYSETEFQLGELAGIKNRILEVGRSCVAPAYRDGRTIQMLWGGIAQYIEKHEYDMLIGCASVHLSGLKPLNEIYSYLSRKNILTDRYGAEPLETHRIEGLQLLKEGLPDDQELFRRLPPLMKGYQWLGAEIGADPAFDGVFRTVDFLIVLDRGRITKRYKRLFSQPIATAAVLGDRGAADV
ncbi:GNAT family N-acetyltransferase [Paenibacillus koleovorans]|uniref:GNAT family N-acetyltransferase n=1 Tax=Paenibacillus koleovorans TaxID=121608 RepID=UPI000FD8DF63|nr:GNAT family N-acyltransferase [Paenibacillus koleovorans]